MEASLWLNEKSQYESVAKGWLSALCWWGSSCPYPWLIVEKNGCWDDDDKSDFVAGFYENSNICWTLDKFSMWCRTGASWPGMDFILSVSINFIYFEVFVCSYICHDSNMEVLLLLRWCLVENTTSDRTSGVRKSMLLNSFFTRRNITLIFSWTTTTKCLIIIIIYFLFIYFYFYFFFRDKSC